MNFDWTFNIGSLLQLFSILGAGAFVFANIQTKLALLVSEKRLEHTTNVTRFDTIDQRFNSLDKELESLTKVIVDLATQHQRLNHVEEAIQEIKDRINKLHPNRTRRKSA